MNLPQPHTTLKAFSLSTQRFLQMWVFIQQLRLVQRLLSILTLWLADPRYHRTAPPQSGFRFPLRGAPLALGVGQSTCGPPLPGAPLLGGADITRPILVVFSCTVQSSLVGGVHEYMVGVLSLCSVSSSWGVGEGLALSGLCILSAYWHGSCMGGIWTNCIKVTPHTICSV
jgi:hypothetical protein